MRTIETALWPPEQPTGLGTGISVGVEGEPHIAGLAENELVLLRDIDIQAVVRAHKVTLNGREVWFGEFQGDIEERPAVEEVTKGRA